MCRTRGDRGHERCDPGWRDPGRRPRAAADGAADGAADDAARAAPIRGVGDDPLPGIFREMKAAIEHPDGGEKNEASREQHRSRAKRLLQLLAAAGWTEVDVRDRSWADAKEVLDTARENREISEAHWKALRTTGRKWGIDIGFFQGV